MNTDIETDLIFRRFDASRQDQIRQLVSYATLLGLTADDLVSIGNRLKRIKLSNEVNSNKSRIKDQLENIHYVNYRRNKLQFIYTNHNNVKYNCSFKSVYDNYVTVYNDLTKDRKQFRLKHYEVGKGINGTTGIFLLNIVNGDITLDF